MTHWLNEPSTSTTFEPGQMTAHIGRAEYHIRIRFRFPERQTFPRSYRIILGIDSKDWHANVEQSVYRRGISIVGTNCGISPSRALDLGVEVC